MATPGEAIATRLLGEPAVKALVGTRVAPSKPTQEPAGDYLVYFKTGGGDGLNAAGRKALQEYTFRIDCYAATDAAAQAILGAVVPALSGWSDPDAGVKGCFPVADEDDATIEDGRQVAGKTFRIFFLG